MYSYHSANTLQFVVSIYQNESLSSSKKLSGSCTSCLVCTASRIKPNEKLVVAVRFYKHCNGWVLLNKDRIDGVICLIRVLLSTCYEAEMQL